MKKYIFFILIVLSSCTTRYYIDPSGSDITGDGSKIRPWATLGFAVSKCDSGDIVSINPGNYLIESSISIPVGVSIEAKDTTAVITSKVIGSRHGQGITNPTLSFVSTVQNTAGNQYVKNIKFNGLGIAASAIFVKYRSNIDIIGCVVEDFYANGITFMGGADSDVEPVSYSTGNSVSGCRIWNCGDTPGTWDGGALIQAGGQEGFELSYCNLKNNKRATGHNSNIMNVGHWNKGFLYHHNISVKPYYETAWNFHLEMMDCRGGTEIYENKSYGGDVFVDIAWHTWEKGDYDFSCSIHDNYIYDNPVLHSGHGKNAIDIEPLNGSDIFIYNNHFDGVVSMIGASDNTFNNNKWSNIHVYNNIAENCGYNNTTDWVNVISFSLAGNTSTAKDIFFYNNLIESNSIHHTTAIKLMTATGARIDNFRIKNNIIVGHHNGTFLNVVNNGTIDSLFVDHNLLFDNSGNNNPVFSGNPVTYTFLNNLQGLDPLFVSDTDFHLQSNSPAIGAGINVGLTVNYDGVSYSDPPNIGCL